VIISIALSLSVVQQSKAKWQAITLCFYKQLNAAYTTKLAFYATRFDKKANLFQINIKEPNYAHSQRRVSFACYSEVY
ncbi:uncharacterized protein METZ01_LOCUS81176, partial [marine metagenome]